jgi:hypothetical protein
MRRARSTIADVATRAGVGMSTVSRVLNGGQVSAPARERVLTAIDDLGYRPQASARALVTGATGTLALVIPFVTHPSAVERPSTPRTTRSSSATSQPRASATTTSAAACRWTGATGC